MSEERVAAEFQMGIRYAVPGSAADAAGPATRSAILRRLGCVGVVVQDDAPPKVGERLLLELDTPEGTVRFAAQVIVRLRGPGESPWGFGAQIADVDEGVASRLLAIRMGMEQQPAAAAR